jgi:hypothetical protein
MLKTKKKLVPMCRKMAVTKCNDLRSGLKELQNNVPDFFLKKMLSLGYTVCEILITGR